MRNLKEGNVAMCNNIIVIGHLSIDHIKNHFFDCSNIAGGGVLYAAIAANVRGNVTILSTKCEDFPQAVLTELEEHGIKNRVINILGEQRRSFMEYSDKFDRTSYDHGRRIWYLRTIEQCPRHLPEEKGGVMLLQAMLPEIQKEYAIWGKKHGYIIAADTSEYFAEYETKKLEELLEHIDIFLPSEVEMDFLFKEENTDDGEKQRRDRTSGAGKIKKIKEKGVKILVEKCADKGCNIYDFTNKKAIKIGIRKVEARDATGAGDTFNGAFISAFASRMSLIESGKYAAVLASMCVEGIGYKNTICQTQEKVLQFVNDISSEIKEWTI